MLTAAQYWAAVFFWSDRLQFHPAAQILTWCLLVASMQVLTLGTLFATAGLVLLCAFVISRHKLIQLLRRTRWIMLSLLLIYAYSTPGQALSDMLGMFSPSREGLTDGVLQLSRLLAALAGLAILLDRLHRQQLIAGSIPCLRHCNGWGCRANGLRCGWL